MTGGVYIGWLVELKDVVSPPFEDTTLEELLTGLLAGGARLLVGGAGGV